MIKLVAKINNRFSIEGISLTIRKLSSFSIIHQLKTQVKLSIIFLGSDYRKMQIITW